MGDSTLQSTDPKKARRKKLFEQTGELLQNIQQLLTLATELENQGDKEEANQLYDIINDVLDNYEGLNETAKELLLEN